MGPHGRRAINPSDIVVFAQKNNLQRADGRLAAPSPPFSQMFLESVSRTAFCKPAGKTADLTDAQIDREDLMPKDVHAATSFRRNPKTKRVEFRPYRDKWIFLIQSALPSPEIFLPPAPGDLMFAPPLLAHYERAQFDAAAAARSPQMIARPRTPGGAIQRAPGRARPRRRARARGHRAVAREPERAHDAGQPERGRRDDLLAADDRGRGAARSVRSLSRSPRRRCCASGRAAAPTASCSTRRRRARRPARRAHDGRAAALGRRGRGRGGGRARASGSYSFQAGAGGRAARDRAGRRRRRTAARRSRRRAAARSSATRAR